MWIKLSTLQERWGQLGAGQQSYPHFPASYPHFPSGLSTGLQDSRGCNYILWHGFAGWLNGYVFRWRRQSYPHIHSPYYYCYTYLYKNICKKIVVVNKKKPWICG